MACCGRSRTAGPTARRPRPRHEHGADVPARIEVAAASGEVVLFDPRMIVSRMQVRWLTCVMVRPAWRRAAAGTSPMLTRRLRCPIAPRTAYGAVAVTDSFSLGFSHRERSPGVGIRLPAGENRGGLPGLPVAECPRPREHGHYGTLRRRRRGASPAAPREPGHVHGLRVVVIGLGGDASRQARATGARRLVPYWSAAVSRRRREGGPGRRRWRVPGWRVLVAGGAPGSGSGCGGRLFCVTA